MAVASEPALTPEMVTYQPVRICLVNAHRVSLLYSCLHRKLRYFREPIGELRNNLSVRDSEHLHVWLLLLEENPEAQGGSCG